MALLDLLPYLIGNLSDAPESLLRRLFEVTHLAVRLTDDPDRVTISVRLPRDTMPEIVSAAEQVGEKIHKTTKRLVTM